MILHIKRQAPFVFFMNHVDNIAEDGIHLIAKGNDKMRIPQ